MGISVSLNKSIINKRHDPQADSALWEKVTVTPEQFSELIKKGYAYCGALFNTYSLGRKGDNFKSAELISIDVDNSIGSGEQKRRMTDEEGYLSFEDALSDPFIKENALLVYTSCSYVDDWHRFRIVFQLSETVTDREMYKSYILALINKIGGDSACKDITRMFYGNTGANVTILGNTLDVKLLKSMINTSPEHKSYHKKNDSVSYEWVTAEVAREMLACIPPEPGYDIWDKILSALGNYFDERTAINLIDEWSPDRKQGTKYKIEHRLKDISIATLIYYAKEYGYKFSPRDSYAGNRKFETFANGKASNPQNGSKPCYSQNNNGCSGEGLVERIESLQPGKADEDNLPINSVQHTESDSFSVTSVSNAEQELSVERSINSVNKPDDFECTDPGNANRFAHRFAGKVKYDKASNTWYIWDDKRFSPDRTGHVMNLAIEVAESIKSEIQPKMDGNKHTELIKWHKSSQSLPRLNAMVEIGGCNPNISITHDKLDSDPNLFNLNNGTYDLNQNILIPHNPRYLLSKIANVDYKPEAVCPAWIKIINRIFDNNPDLINFVKRAVGYSMYGAIKDQVSFFCFGNGANGKSIFFEVIRSVFGDYCQKSSADIILERQNEGVPNDIARLDSTRLAQLSEIPENKRLNESRLKDLTGGDRTAARFLNKEYFEFNPVAKLWLMGNHKPRINGLDYGIWRRILIIPFLVTIPEDERIPMDELLAILRMELSGILNWIIEGWRDYQQNGLNRPAIVQELTEAYHVDQDIVSHFLNESCIMNPVFSIVAAELYSSYKEWCASNGFTPGRTETFINKLRLRAIKRIKEMAISRSLPGLNYAKVLALSYISYKSY